MTTWDDKVRVVVGAVSLELPAAVKKRGDAAIDSAAGVFEGAGLMVTIDQGPFASRLEAYVGRPGYREGSKDVGGTRGRTVFFQNPDGRTYITALHLPAPKPVTVVVQADASVPEEIPGAILDTLQLLD